MARKGAAAYRRLMEIQLAKYDQDLDDELAKADRLCSEGKSAEAIVELLGALLIEVRALREERRRSNAQRT